MDRYGELIRRARETEGLNQAELAAAINVDATMIGKIERGKVGISQTVYRKLVGGVLPTLRAVDLLNAIGYPVTVQGADQLPISLVKDLLRLDDESMRAIAVLARQRQRQDRPQDPTAPQ